MPAEFPKFDRAISDRVIRNGTGGMKTEQAKSLWRGADSVFNYRPAARRTIRSMETLIRSAFGDDSAYDVGRGIG